MDLLDLEGAGSGGGPTRNRGVRDHRAPQTVSSYPTGVGLGLRIPRRIADYTRNLVPLGGQSIHLVLEHHASNSVLGHPVHPERYADYASSYGIDHNIHLAPAEVVAA